MKRKIGTSWVVGDVDLDAIDWQRRALAMHQENGLIDEMEDDQERMPLEQIDGAMAEIVLDAGFPTRLKPAGSSVHFDMSFIDVHMPQLRKVLHGHRRFDVSTLRSVRRMDQESDGIPHRAMDDVERDVEWVTQWLKGNLNAH